MKSKGGFQLNYFFIPLTVFSIAAMGSAVTMMGMDWYRQLQMPVFTPSGSFIGTVWTALYVLIAIAALFVYNHVKKEPARGRLLHLFVINGIANLAWSVIFFGFQSLTGALIEIGILWFSTLVLIIAAWKPARLAAVFLMPYLLWVTFASFLMYKFWEINPLVR